jgi:hypothetical protein
MAKMWTRRESGITFRSGFCNPRHREISLTRLAPRSSRAGAMLVISPVGTPCTARCGSPASAWKRMRSRRHAGHKCSRSAFRRRTLTNLGDHGGCLRSFGPGGELFRSSLAPHELASQRSCRPRSRSAARFRPSGAKLGLRIVQRRRGAVRRCRYYRDDRPNSPQVWQGRGRYDEPLPLA